MTTIAAAVEVDKTATVDLKAPSGTPLANVMLSVLQALGLRDLDRFGDSDGLYNIEHGQPS